MEAFITLATNDSYCSGACVLAHSLRRVGTTRQLVVMITPQVSEDMRYVLRQLFDHVEVVDVMRSDDPSNLRLLGRQDLGQTFTKLHCWRLTQYTKGVFMDADTLVLKNIDDIFEREELSAAPDPGWPDCFNSGVFVFKPSLETYNDLVTFAVERGSFDGADQGLLNRYFSDWATKDIARHLPFLYNCSMWEFYSYLPALKEYRSQVRVVHFIGPYKPWHHPMRHDGSVEPIGGNTYRDDVLRQWWGAFVSGVQPLFTKSLSSRRHCPPSSRSVPSIVPPMATHVSDSLRFMHRPTVPPPRYFGRPADMGSSGHFTSVPKVEVVTVEGPPPTVRPPSPYSPGTPSPGTSSMSLPVVSSTTSPEVTPSPEAKEYPGHVVSPVMAPAPHHIGAAAVGDTCPVVGRPSNSEEHRAAWERGEIDYTGVDRFENILAKLNESMKTKSSAKSSTEYGDHLRPRKGRRKASPAKGTTRDKDSKYKSPSRKILTGDAEPMIKTSSGKISTAGTEPTLKASPGDVTSPGTEPLLKISAGKDAALDTKTVLRVPSGKTTTSKVSSKSKLSSRKATTPEADSVEDRSSDEATSKRKSTEKTSTDKAETSELEITAKTSTEKGASAEEEKQTGSSNEVSALEETAYRGVPDDVPAARRETKDKSSCDEKRTVEKSQTKS